MATRPETLPAPPDAAPASPAPGAAPASPNGAAPAASASAAAPKQRRGGRVRRVVLVPILLAVLGAAGYFGYNFWLNNQLYVSTDDALVDANLVPIAAPASGTLTNWRIQSGDFVRAGQVLGTVRVAAATAPLVNILAPQDGTVLKVDGKVGQVIGAAQAIAYMADLSGLTVTAYVNEADIHRLRVGQPVDITADGAGGAVYSGTLAEIIPATASQFSLIPSQDRGSGNFTKVTQRIEVHVALDAANTSGLYPGMNAQVRIHVA